MTENDWVSVDDGLPMHATSVLIRTVRGELMQGKYVNCADDPKQGFVVPAELQYNDITHWKYDVLHE